MVKLMENGRYYAFISWEQRQKAEINGIDYMNLFNRVYTLGWDVEKAITTPIRRRPTRGEQYGQETLDNLKKYNIKYNTFISRIRHGWDIKEACTTPPLSGIQRGKRMTEKFEKKGYKGGLKKEHFEIAKKNGIEKLTVYNRVSNLRWDIERAITEPLNLEKCGYYTKLRNKQLARMKELEG